VTLVNIVIPTKYIDDQLTDYSLFLEDRAPGQSCNAGRDSQQKEDQNED